MNLIDRIRIERALASYDFWLDLRGVRRTRRKDLRRELRANLTEASADVGVTEALFGIGSPKALAYAASPPHPGRPRWNTAALWAALTLAVVVLGLLFTSFTFIDAISASGVRDREVTGGAFPWLGAEFSATVAGDGSGMSGGFSAPWTVVLPPVVVFLLVAQPWRLLRRQANPATLAREF